MHTPKYPTNPEWVMYDPVVKPPPLGVRLWVYTDGGRTIEDEWREEYLAWCYFPKVPETVKDRQRAQLQGITRKPPLVTK